MKEFFSVDDVSCILIPRSTRAASAIVLSCMDLAKRNKKKIYIYGDATNSVPRAPIVKSIFESAEIVHVAVSRGQALPKIKKNELHVFCSDLIRHSRENRSLFFPQQVSKLKQDAPTISALSSASVDDLKMHLSADARLCSDPLTLLLLCRVCNAKKMSGKVIDYQDSIQLLNKSSRHLIFSRPHVSLTSYVGMAFHASANVLDLTSFDVDFLLGILKSHILRDLNRKRYRLFIPGWHPISKRKHGVSVSTHLNSEPYCESIALEDGTRTTAELFLKACNECICPTRKRWHSPGVCVELTRYIFSIELIEPKKRWRVFAGHRALNVLNLSDKRSGACLELGPEQLAVYLPNKKSSFWECRSYIDSLYKAAKKGESSEGWELGRLYTFTTQKFVWKR